MRIRIYKDATLKYHFRIFNEQKTEVASIVWNEGLFLLLIKSRIRHKTSFQLLTALLEYFRYQFMRLRTPMIPAVS